MGKHHHPTDEEPPAAVGEAVACNIGGAYWSVDDCAWSSLRPGLPDNLVDLLAPPIVVGAAPVAGVARPPASAPTPSPPPAVRAVITGTPGSATAIAGGAPGGVSPVVVPATPLTVRTRNTGTRRPPGRHRRGSPTR